MNVPAKKYTLKKAPLSLALPQLLAPAFPAGCHIPVENFHYLPRGSEVSCQWVLSKRCKCQWCFPELMGGLYNEKI